MTHLKEGDKAPEFSGQDQKGRPVKLSKYKGKKIILFFYPHDNTPTCTIEACNLKDNYRLLRKMGFVTIGVSPDSVKKHQNFIKKFRLPYTLISDPELTMIKAYGVWGTKQFMGRTFDGLHRTTFVIDEEGTIEKIILKVISKDHAAQILETFAEVL